MSAFRTWAYAAGASATALGLLLVGCTASSSGSGLGSADTAGYGGPGSAGAPSGGSGGGVQLVDVDPNQTLTAQPGQGVGVFTQYQSGGHWTVWWTCDTNVTSLPCNFQIDVTVASGTITNVVNQLTEQGALLSQPSSNEVSATTTTTTAVDGIVFDTTPGAVITLDAKVGGTDDGSFLFFVQDGQVNGGYQGTLSDPLMLEPSSP
jgi:hypothetical protein